MKLFGIEFIKRKYDVKSPQDLKAAQDTIAHLESELESQQKT
jgi:hypothetical protein